MALSPMLKQKRGLFGSVAAVPQQPPVTASERPLAPKQNFFGEGGAGRGIAGSVGDFLLQYAGMNPIYAPAQQQRQAAAYDEKQYQRRRADTLADWQARQEYERANPAPINNDTVNDYQFLASKLGPDAAKQYLQNLADGPPVAVDVANPDGSVTRQFIPRSQMQGGGGMVAPQKPVGALKPYGGQTATPSGNFR